MKQSHSAQKLLQSIRDTNALWQLFQPEDKLLIGISGGKDSLALLDCLAQLGLPNLHSVHIRIEPDAPVPFADFCRERSVFTILDSDILLEVKSAKRHNICYMCSRRKRKLIAEYAVAQGFATIVLAHHLDDMLETFLLNLFFQRELSTMLPNQELFGGKLRIIRPFYQTAEKDIIRYAKTNQLPVSAWQCGYETHSRRHWLKQQIRLWQQAHPKLNLKDNLFQAITHINPDFLPIKK